MQDEINEKNRCHFHKGNQTNGADASKGVKALACSNEKQHDKKQNPPRQTDAKAACSTERRAIQH